MDTDEEKKPKRQLSEKQLAQLAKAREKANAVRKRKSRTTHCCDGELGWRQQEPGGS